MFKRMLKDPAMRVFLIHVIGFVFVVGTLAALNLWLTPDRYWFIWLLAGWGIALAAHGLALLLKRTHRRERIFIDPKARTFVVQLFAYLAVVLLLFVVNLTQTPKTWWFYWVALGWGAGVAAQGWCVFYRHRRSRPVQSQPRVIEKSEKAPAGATRKPAKAKTGSKRPTAR
jgi:predicted membrane channel-forming protein YqfA (hemolysin III family)